MGLAQSTTLPAATWRPWPARSRAEVAFFLGERSAADRIARRLFGRAIPPSRYAGLAGAPDDARVTVGVSGGRLYLEMHDPTAAAYCGYYYLYSKKSAVVLLNDGFCINVGRLRGCGLGLQMFYRQVRNAARIGVDWMEAMAGRSDRENGYYSWPRYGWDGRLPRGVRRQLPVDLKKFRTLLELMSCEEGRTWWRTHGAAVFVRFDLTRGSRSHRTLVEYLRERIRASAARKNHENTQRASYGIAQ
ncbi:MAG: hypothetical protein ABFC77_02825 [Thermoguttaceae bacterium]